MNERARATERETREPTPSPRAPAPGAPARRPGPSPARALALQRLAGNRVARQVLARWSRHPDPEQKGVMVPDSVAAEYTDLNPPKNE
jgi:hypothetical protein